MLGCKPGIRGKLCSSSRGHPFACSKDRRRGRDQRKPLRPHLHISLLLFLFHSSKISTFECYLSFAVILCFVCFKYTYLLSLVCLSTTFFLVFCNSIKLPSTLAFVGKISYSLYLIHLPIILIIGQTLFDYNMSQKFPNLTVIILTLSAICFSVLFYFLFEKPSLSWAKKLKKA